MSDFDRNLILEDIEAEIIRAVEAGRKEYEEGKKKIEAAALETKAAARKAEEYGKIMLDVYVSTVRFLMNQLNLTFEKAISAANIPAQWVPTVKAML